MGPDVPPDVPPDDDSERVIGLYERHAADFDRERGRSLVERAWLDRFIALLPPCASVLDLGCGSGEPIARYLLSRGLQVTGIDSSPSLIALCKERFPQGRFAVADMRTLDLAQSFDGLLAWNSFFHLRHDDQRAMFAVFAAHASQGSALMFTSGPALGTAVGSFHGEGLYHASLDASEYRSLLAAHGFAVVMHVVEDKSCGGLTVWLPRRD
jgi:SAM-dependent methyltransferase